ncbi:CHASE2 domain-containing protein, partial [bacterium]|nr:CHASE2 domain-containing protein [bacterium]
MYKSSFTKNLDLKIYDISKEFLDQFKTKESDSNVVIVDLDERSLDVIGQWPWPRIVMAKLIDEIAQNNPSVIGLDIIFPEKDRTSP